MIEDVESTLNVYDTRLTWLTIAVTLWRCIDTTNASCWPTHVRRSAWTVDTILSYSSVMVVLDMIFCFHLCFYAAMIDHNSVWHVEMHKFTVSMEFSFTCSFRISWFVCVNPFTVNQIVFYFGSPNHAESLSAFHSVERFAGIFSANTHTQFIECVHIVFHSLNYNEIKALE